MLETTENLIVESLSEALETMAFMTAMPPEEEAPKPTQSVLVNIEFNGPTSGKVELLGGTDFLKALTANVMGIDEDDKEAQSKSIDAFKELVNTTCGVLLPRMASSPAEVFDVTVPQAREFDNTQGWDTFVAQENVTILDVDDYPVAVRLSTTE